MMPKDSNTWRKRTPNPRKIHCKQENDTLFCSLSAPCPSCWMSKQRQYNNSYNEKSRATTTNKVRWILVPTHCWNGTQDFFRLLDRIEPYISQRVLPEFLSFFLLLPSQNVCYYYDHDSGLLSTNTRLMYVYF